MKKALKAIIRHLGYEVRSLQEPSRQVIFDETPARDYELLKSFTTRAAQFFRSPGQIQMLRNIHLTGLLRERPYTEQSRVEIGDDNTLDVGLWRRPSPGKNVAFLRRDDRMDEWFYWASNEKIGPKRCKWRVVILGESVARGYLYDPHFNLATALLAMLESGLGTGNIDVVDLARSNQTIQELKAIIGQSMALSPDVLVILAGNNWRAHVTELDIPYVESVLRHDGVPGMKAVLDERREQAARNLIIQATDVLAPERIKVVWVVPEFNLGDWVDPASNAPLLARQDNQRWRDLHRQVRQALRNDDSAAACELARKMTDLDGGASSVPLRVLAECCRSSGNLRGARQYLERCRDAEGWDPSFSYSPRVSSPIQNVLRGAASLASNVVVDLPDILDRQLSGGLPDRRMFLDYCHLTAEGINVAAAAVASQVVSLLAGGKAISPQALLSKSSGPPDKIEGKACLLAAVHNAHFYQRSEIVSYWCDRAIRFWPECAQMMVRFIDYETRGLPMAICRSGLDLLELDELDTVQYLGRGGTRRLDLTLSDAVVASVAKIGIRIEHEIAGLRVKEHSVANGPKELTDFYYSSVVPGLSGGGWTSCSFPSNRGSQCIYASAFWETSTFVFLAEKGQAVKIRFTYRIPMSSASGSVVTVDVNGHPVARLQADQTWHTREIAVPGDCVADGVNEVVVTWPTEEPSSELALSRAADRLLANRLPYFFRVFGEIYTLSVSDLVTQDTLGEPLSPEGLRAGREPGRGRVSTSATRLEPDQSTGSAPLPASFDRSA